MQWQRLSLTEEEDAGIFTEDFLPLLSADAIQLCVVGKVLSTSQINLDAFRSVMKSVWRVHSATRIDKAGDNIFTVKFRSMGEKARVLSSGPWSFDKSLIVFVSPQASDKVSDLSFDEVSFWVQVHNIPLTRQSRDFALMLGEKIGSVEEVDGTDFDNWTGPIIRLRIRLSLKKPKLLVSSSEAVWCPIQYEKLPDFCYSCGFIGHIKKECSSQTPVASTTIDQYGEWLHAIPSKNPPLMNRPAIMKTAEGRQGLRVRSPKDRDLGTVTNPSSETGIVEPAAEITVASIIDDGQDKGNVGAPSPTIVTSTLCNPINAEDFMLTETPKHVMQWESKKGKWLYKQIWA